MRRTRRLADSYYRIVRAKGYSDELNVSAANALLKDLLGEIRVMGDPEAADGVSITL